MNQNFEILNDKIKIILNFKDINCILKFFFNIISVTFYAATSLQLI